MNVKLTVRDLRKLRDKGERIVALTAYDAVIGRLADQAGAHLVLVGDSLGMTQLGYSDTTAVTLEQSLHHTAAVVRGVRHAMVIGDMPFLTFQVNEDEALRNAGRYVQEARADGVKVEGGAEVAAVVNRFVACGIPVLGHIGLLPQRVKAEGGYRVHGRSTTEAERLLADASALEAAGAFAIVLEGLPTALGGQITQALTIPTIGIGAGPECSGQIQVTDDILGLFEDFVPRHTRRYATLAVDIKAAFARYADDVRAGTFPGEAESFE